MSGMAHSPHWISPEERLIQRPHVCLVEAHHTWVTCGKVNIYLDKFSLQYKDCCETWCSLFRQEQMSVPGLLT